MISISKKRIAKEVLIFLSFFLLVGVITLIFFSRYKIAQKYSSEKIYQLNEGIPIKLDSIYVLTEPYMLVTFKVSNDTYDIPYFLKNEFLKDFPDAIQIQPDSIAFLDRNYNFKPNHIDYLSFRNAASDSVYLLNLYAFIVKENFSDVIKLSREVKSYDFSAFDKIVGNPPPKKTPFEVLYFPTVNDFINKTTLALRFENQKEFKREVQNKIKKINSIEKRKNGTEWNLFISKYLFLLLIILGSALYPFRLIVYATKWAIKTLK